MLETQQVVSDGLPPGALLRPLTPQGLPPGALLRPLDMSKVAGATPGMGSPVGANPNSARVQERELAPFDDLPLSVEAKPSMNEPVPGYGTGTIPKIVKGAKEFAGGARLKGAADVLSGINEGLSAGPLPLGAAPEAVLKGVAGSVAGTAIGPRVVKALGGGEDAQALAREAGAALPLAAGVATDTVRGLPAGAQLRAIKDVPRSTSAEVAHADSAPVTPKAPDLPADPDTGRSILQGSDDAKQLRQEAKQAAPVLEQKLKMATDGVPGAEVAAVRPEKAPERVEEKAASGKPVETQSDHLAGRITVETPEAKEAVAANLAKLGEVSRDDTPNANGFQADTHQVIVNPAPDAALRTAEVQVVTPEQHKVAEETHDLYEEQRTAAAKGDTEKAAALGRELEAANHGAAVEADARQNRVVSPLHPEAAREHPKTEYSYGNTQANLPPGSDAHTAIRAAQTQIPDADLAGKGKDVDSLHVTVRYGIQGDDTERLKQFIRSQAPFEAKLGKTEMFPPSKNSDGAAVIQAPVDSTELHRLNAEIEKHADFKQSDFPDYKPHVTVAYVKPEAAEKYVGMNATEGQTFPIKSIAISDREGNKEEVPLLGSPPQNSEMKGGRGESPEQSGGGAVKAAPAGQKWERNSAVLVRDSATGNFRAGQLGYFSSGGGSGPSRGRVNLAGGGKLNGVKEENLFRLSPVKVDGAPRSAQEKAANDFAEANGPKLVEDYLRANTRGGVTTIALDAAKPLFPEFRRDPTGSNIHIENAARAIATSARDTLLSKPPQPGREYVQVVTGSPASGKTSGSPPEVARRIGMRLEAILTDTEKSAALIQKLIDSGRKPALDLFYVDDPRTTVDRMVKRATEEIGRGVAIDFMGRAFVQVPQTVAALQARFGDRIRVASHDNSGSPEDLKSYTGSVEPALKATAGWTVEKAREAMHERLRELQSQGKVTPELFRAVGGKGSPEAKGGSRPGDGGTDAAAPGLGETPP